MIPEIKDIMSLLLQIANLIIIAYGGYKFLNKPHDTLSDEVKQIKEKQVAQDLTLQEVKKELNASFDKHREQEKTNAVFKRVFMLMANFEVAFCLHTGYDHTEDLVKAKEELDKYLAGS